MNFSIALLAQKRPRNRHGRGLRGVKMHPALPAVQTAKTKFDNLVVEIVRQVYKANPKLPKIEFATEEVPVSLPAEWEDYQVSLARAFPRDRSAGLSARIVIYRLPIMNRIHHRGEVEELLQALIINYLCDLVNITPTQLNQNNKYTFSNE